MLFVLSYNAFAQIDTTITDDSSPSRPSNGAAMKISVAPFSSAGIEIVPFGSPKFASLLNGMAPSGTVGVVQPLLPFSVIVNNNSQKTILGYTVVWAAVNADGEPYTDFRGLIDYVSLKPVLVPQQASLATILGPLEWLPLAQPSTTDVIKREFDRFESRASVTISLDAVLFQDGTTLGGDRFSTIADMRARIRAEYDLYSSVVARADSGASDAQILTSLQTVSASVPVGVSQRTLGADPYTRRYRVYSARIAGALLQTIERGGTALMINGVRMMLQTKPYPKELLQ
jgi:hypothetical protein